MVNYTRVCAVLDAFELEDVLYAMDLTFRDALVASGAGAWLSADRAAASHNIPCSILTEAVTDSASWQHAHAVHLYLAFSKHYVGQWAQARSGDALIRAAAYRDGVTSEYTHGIVWHTMLTQAAQPMPAEMARRFATEVCCAACRGRGCSDECSVRAEGDWYWACFHGYGHGAMLVALAENRSSFSAHAPCSPVQWFSQPAAPARLAQAEAACDVAVASRGGNRKACFLGVYMHYFELLALDRRAWASACDNAVCSAACVAKCRQFASDIFDPVLPYSTGPVEARLSDSAGELSWPAAVLCYGDTPLTQAQAVALDDRFAPYAPSSFAIAANRPFYTRETELQLFDAIGTRHWNACF